MAKKVEATVLSTLQDLLIFQMASKGVPQGQIRGDGETDGTDPIYYFPLA
jgi:hypothetical protein